MATEHRFGPHTFRIEDEVVVIRYVGGATVAEFQQQVALFQTIGERVQRMYVLVDLAHAALSEPAARKYLAEQAQSAPQQPLGLICFNASVLTRTAVTLVMRAMRVIGRTFISTEFVRNEAEARALVATRLRERR